jgi:hypothetical protein
MLLARGAGDGGLRCASLLMLKGRGFVVVGFGGGGFNKRLDVPGAFPGGGLGGGGVDERKLDVLGALLGGGFMGGGFDKRKLDVLGAFLEGGAFDDP